MRSCSCFLLFILCSLPSVAQIVGKVTDREGDPLPFVNIYLEDRFTGTTTNESGEYELEVLGSGDYAVVFQFLGYKTERREISASSFPVRLDVTLTEESTTLREVVVNSADNPANRIMNNAIEKRQVHKSRIRAYTANFYSRGIWRIIDAPERILGQEVGDLGGSLDSTRSGIVYLSETISTINYRAPNDFQEKVIASKVSGNDNGFSLNSAQEATISFYNNTIRLNNEIISPLADYAFNYYNFRLEGVFYNERGDLINKIRVVPKRPKDKVFRGFVYITEDTWQLYGIELTTTGEAMQVPPIEELIFKQNFNYSESQQLWVPISQTVDFSFAMFGIKGNGRFTAVYTNYDFNPQFAERTFTREIVSFAEEANKKDSVYWRHHRPVPLTAEEKEDYQKKDSLQVLRTSKTYLDSVDRVQNEFQFMDLVTGYSYNNSFEKWTLDISSPLLNTNLNTVQGYHSSLKTSFRKYTDESYGTYWRIFTDLNYGFSEDRLRFFGGFQQKFNNISKPILTISGGSTLNQINDREPISPHLNNITTAFFERNYMKLYELEFARFSYQQELFNGFEGFVSFGYENRSPLFNNKYNFLIDWDEREFTSNNPLAPRAYGTAPFEEHQIYRLSFSAQINFAQEYLSYPNAKYNVPNDQYPTLFMSYETGLGADIAEYDFQHLRLRIKHEIAIGTAGRLSYDAMAGTFFDDSTVSFIDHRHFNGNQTRIGTTSNYLGHFNLLPYYSRSTANNYIEGHLEHNFRGWILGKIPLVNRLNFSLVAGAHALVTEEAKPYTEYSLGLDNVGFGKFRFMRLDYVVNNYNGNSKGAFIFGLKFLNIL